MNAEQMRGSQKFVYFFAVLFLTFGLLEPHVMAIEDWVTKDYKYVTKGEQYIFVMLAPPQDAKNPVEEGREDPGIRKIYHESGLYRNDGSTTPLWTVDWYSTLVHVS